MAAHWVQLQDGASRQPYYYNQLTARTQWVQPVKPEKARSLCPVPPHSVTTCFHNSSGW